MCEPASIIAVSSLAISTGAAVADHISGQKATKSNKTAALKAQDIQINDLTARQREESAAIGQQRGLVKRQSREAAAMARLSAAEAGVSGGSVDALLGDLAFDEGSAIYALDQNETVTLDQLERAKSGVRAGTENRIAALPSPSPWSTGLKIVGAGVDTASSFYARRGPKDIT